MRIWMLLLSVPLLTLLGSAQDEQDPYAITIVKFELQMRSGQSKMVHGFSQKQIFRLGDSVSIALLKILDDEQMLDPRNIAASMTMIRDAFSRPDLISIEVNKKPQVTLLLLNHIRGMISDPQMSTDLDQTVKFVKEHTT
jgi:hypothetical protein